MNTIPIIEVPENKAGVNFPHLTYIKASQLIWNDGSDPTSLNRVIKGGLTNTMMGTIREDGFMDVIKVFPSNTKNDKGEPMYEIAEAQHRGKSVKDIMVNAGEDGYVAIGILWWKNIDDKDDILSSIKTLNTIGKGWEIYDYAVSNAKMTNWPNNKLHVEIRDNMKLLYGNGTKKLMTNACVAQLYTFEIRGQLKLKDGKKAPNFKLDTRKTIIKDTLLDSIPSLVSKVGFKKAGCQFQKRLIKALQFHDLAKDQSTLNEWFKFVDHTVKMAVISSTLPDGDNTFFEWFSNVELTFK